MTETSRRRQPAMSPEDRRAALITATIPLLHKHGLDVSTRQIAVAAGVAEGTIFGVFPGKSALITAALTQALDPQPTLDRLYAISPRLGLRERLIQAVDLINERFTTNAHLMTAARIFIISGEADAESAAKMRRARERLLTAVTELIAPDADRVRRSPATTARLLLLFAGGQTYGPFGDPDHFTSADMVSLVLDGLLVRDTDTESAAVPLHTDTGVS